MHIFVSNFILIIMEAGMQRGFLLYTIKEGIASPDIVNSFQIIPTSKITFQTSLLNLCHYIPKATLFDIFLAICFGAGWMYAVLELRSTLYYRRRGSRPVYNCSRELANLTAGSIYPIAILSIRKKQIASHSLSLSLCLCLSLSNSS